MKGDDAGGDSAATSLEFQVLSGSSFTLHVGVGATVPDVKRAVSQHLRVCCPLVSLVSASGTPVRDQDTAALTSLEPLLVVVEPYLDLIDVFSSVSRAARRIVRDQQGAVLSSVRLTENTDETAAVYEKSRFSSSMSQRAAQLTGCVVSLQDYDDDEKAARCTLNEEDEEWIWVPVELLSTVDRAPLALPLRRETVLECAEWTASPVTSLGAHEKSTAVVSGHHDGSVCSWVGSQGLLMSPGHQAAVRGLCVLPVDTGYAISCSDDGTLAIWDLFSLTRKVVMEGHSAAVTSVIDVYGDCRAYASCSADGLLKLWNNLGVCKYTWPFYPEDKIGVPHALARFELKAPQEFRGIACAHGEGDIIIWNMSNVRPSCELASHGVRIRAIAGTAPWIVTAGEDLHLLVQEVDVANVGVPPHCITKNVSLSTRRIAIDTWIESLCIPTCGGAMFVATSVDLQVWSSDVKEEGKKVAKVSPEETVSLDSGSCMAISASSLLVGSADGTVSRYALASCLLQEPTVSW